MEQELYSQGVKELLKALLTLRNIEEGRQFLRDLCTLEEIKNMSDRWQIVQELSRDKTYRDIANKVKTSTATVTRVANWLRHGTGGYRRILRRVSHHALPRSVGSGVH